MRIVDPSSLSNHPAANLFPFMSSAEIAELANNIKKIGQQIPVELLDGLVIDGRNRVSACLQANLDVEVTDTDLSGLSPIDYVVTRNLYRRHLTTSQRAIVAAKIREAYIEEGKETREENLRRGPTNARKRKNKFSGNSSQRAARLLHVSPSSVDHAVKVIRSDSPRLKAAVELGNIAVSVAAQLADEPTDIINKILTEPHPVAPGIMTPAGPDKIRRRMKDLKSEKDKEVDSIAVHTRSVAVAVFELNRIIEQSELFTDDDYKILKMEIIVESCVKMLDVLPRIIARKFADNEEEKAKFKLMIEDQIRNPYLKISRIIHDLHR